MTISRRRIFSRPAVAWTIAIVQVLLLAQGAAFWAWHGRLFAAEFAIPGSMAMALVGALVASKQASNRFGWLLIAMPVPGLIAFLCTEYSDMVALRQLALPLEPFVSWVGEWVWTPSVGFGISMLTLRFPDGRVPGRWRFVDLIAGTGTVILTATFAWVTFPGTRLVVTPVQTALIGAGFAVVAMGGVFSFWSLLWRYRHGQRDLRLQMKWILLATLVVTMALVFAAILSAVYSARFDWALGPVYAALICIPVAIGVAILRHRLFDIDLIISRTLVYVIVTAILGGLYIGVIELMQQVSILYTGQRSETAIVLTAFVVAGAFRPVEKWTDHAVERRFRRGDVAARLRSISDGAESVVRVIDPHGFARWLLDEAATAFEADGGAIYVYAHHPSDPLHRRGSVGDGTSPLEIPVHHDGHELGRIVLGRRRGGVDYSNRDVEALKRSGAALGAALALATELGHLTRPGIRESVADGGGERVRPTRRSVAASGRG